MAMRETPGPRGFRAEIYRRLFTVGMLIALSCGRDAVAQGDPKGEIRLIFSYGSEKKTWVEEATKAFNAKKVLQDGEPIFVETKPAGSNVIVSEALEGKPQVHLISPASRIFMEIANGEAIEKGQQRLVDPDTIQNLVNSPLVVATWPDMAVKLGWDAQAPSWRDIFKFAAEPAAWGPFRNKKWRSFKYGHTHPDYSNSGLLAVVAEVYAHVGKFDKPETITLADMRSKDLIKYLSQVEGGVIHYGESTGFFATKMFDAVNGGPQFLSASILYENLVFEENQKAQKKDPAAYAKSGPKVVAVYPAEGTFANEHPVAVVEREWVTPKHRAAALQYISFLRSPEWQKRACELGFRPAISGIPVDDILKPEYGVDASRFNDAEALKLPPYSIIKQIRPAWRAAKRPADIVLAIDTSGSMNEPVTVGGKQVSRIKLAEEAAKEFVKELSTGDQLTVLLFDDSVTYLLGPNSPTRQMDEKGRAEVLANLTDIQAGGLTALYDVVDVAHDILRQRGGKSNRGIVVLSDGKHEKGENPAQKDAAKAKTLQTVHNDGETNIFVFTIGYGDEHDPRALLDVDVLKKLATESKGKYFPAKPEGIREVLRQIVTFF